jgi:hypothetical protein
MTCSTETVEVNLSTELWVRNNLFTHISTGSTDILIGDYFLKGHIASLASNLSITSQSNSGGKFAQQLLWMTDAGSCNSWTTL